MSFFTASFFDLVERNRLGNLFLELVKLLTDELSLFIFRSIVSICVNITQFGASTVFLLLSSKNIQDFLNAFFGWNVNFCVLIMVIALFLLPVTLLKSPQDFW